jgi:NACalpha-BTF3-like transcription factor
MKNEEKTITEAIETIAIQTIAKFAEKIAEKLYDYEHGADETDVDANLTAEDLALILEQVAREIKRKALDENAGAAEPIQGRRHPQPRGIQK